MMNQNMMDRMKELIITLNAASEAYYALDNEIMSNYEYDALYDELVKLEAESGVTLSDSPTINVGYEAVDNLPKKAHESPMLSLAKTKDREELRTWLNGHDGLLSWKLDGLTIVLTYDNGELIEAVTRGNGEVGEVITPNAKTFKNIPLKINYKEKLIIRGEAVITYSDFELINSKINDVDGKYKNPRNLCSGSVRQLDSKITASRNVRFYAFNLVTTDYDFNNSIENQFIFLSKLGFDVVDYKRVNENTILDSIEWFAKEIMEYNVPSDGLVLTYDDIEYGKSLGRTAKAPRNAIAFKWADEIKETTLTNIEWSASRTGLINPVAIFDTVDLEGTNVSRASLHNVSYIEDLKLGIGDKVTVYKANMIIPQIAENLTKSGNYDIPSKCPVCGGETVIREDNASKMLYCVNKDCIAKKLKSFSHYTERNSMNIEGLSEQTLEKFIAKGFIKSFTDMYKLDRYKDEIICMDGFGEKSYENIIESINKSRKSTLANLITALGINGIGSANSKMICKTFDYDFQRILFASIDELTAIDGVGEVMASNIFEYMHDDNNIVLMNELLNELELVKPVSNNNENLSGMSFVITGSLNNYENRDALKAIIEDRGGKVTGSVTSKTTALINNDATSSSSKNKKAKELGIDIITEAEFEANYLL